MDRNKKREKSYDFTLLFTMFGIICIGLIMVLSSSWPEAIKNPAYNGDGLYFFKRQLFFLGIGFIGMLITMNINFRLWKKLSLPIFIFGMGLGLLVLSPLGVELHGATRWIRLPGGILFMPSDVMKVASIIFLASFLSNRKRRIKKFLDGYILSLLIIAIPFGIIVLFQKDLGTALTLGISLVTLLFVGGVRIHYLIGTGIIGTVGGAWFVFKEEYRIQRVKTFLDPFEDKLGSSFQIVQSLYAIGSGGLLGSGLGQSKQKYYYIPEPFSDFIFAIFAEEFGFLGIAIIIGLYTIVAWRGIRIALGVRSAFGSYLATGITMLILVQALIHIAVVSSSIPATGITMPFMSYGGTSLVIYMTLFGILLNISKNVKKGEKIN